MGLLLERGVIRFLYKRPLESLLATWGVSLCCNNSFANLRRGQRPGQFTELAERQLRGERCLLAYNRLFVIGFAVFVVSLTYLLLTRTSLGLQIRAVMQNRNMASALGVRHRSREHADLRLRLRPGRIGRRVPFANRQRRSQPRPGLHRGLLHDRGPGGVGNIVGTVSASLGIGVDRSNPATAGSAPCSGKISAGAIILFLQWRPAGCLSRAAAVSKVKLMTTPFQKRELCSSRPLALFGLSCCRASMLRAAGELLACQQFQHQPLRQVSLLRVLAISVDLLWGYTGLLSLGQALFFSLGGYMLGMHLMLHDRRARPVPKPTFPISWCFWIPEAFRRPRSAAALDSVQAFLVRGR